MERVNNRVHVAHDLEVGWNLLQILRHKVPDRSKRIARESPEDARQRQQG